MGVIAAVAVAAVAVLALAAVACWKRWALGCRKGKTQKKRNTKDVIDIEQTDGRIEEVGERKEEKHTEDVVAGAVIGTMLD